MFVVYFSKSVIVSPLNVKDTCGVVKVHEGNFSKE